jgi:hypothetical protein
MGGGGLVFVNVCGLDNMAEHLAAILQSQQDLFFFYDSIRIPHFTKSGCPINYIQPRSPLPPHEFTSRTFSKRLKMHEPTENEIQCIGVKYDWVETKLFCFA